MGVRCERSRAFFQDGPAASGATFQATALVHEAWLKLAGSGREQQWEGRKHFFSAAAEAMRHILIDRARRWLAVRHGGDQQRLDIDDIEVAAPVEQPTILSLSGFSMARRWCCGPWCEATLELRFRCCGCSRQFPGETSGNSFRRS